MSEGFDPLVMKYFPNGIPEVLKKYFPNGTPKCWREKFPNGAPLETFAGLRGQAAIDKLKEIFGGELPGEFKAFENGFPEDLIAFVRHFNSKPVSPK